MSATIIFKGNLVRDPQLVQSENGIAKCDFTVAVPHREKLDDGKPVYDYYDCISYGKPAMTMMNIGQKGTNVTIVGEFEHKEFKNKDGIDRCRLHVDVSKCEYNQRTKITENAKKNEEEKAEDND